LEEIGRVGERVDNTTRLILNGPDESGINRATKEAFESLDNMKKYYIMLFWSQGFGTNPIDDICSKREGLMKSTVSFCFLYAICKDS